MPHAPVFCRHSGATFTKAHVARHRHLLSCEVVLHVVRMPPTACRPPSALSCQLIEHVRQPCKRPPAPRIATNRHQDFADISGEVGRKPFFCMELCCNWNFRKSRKCNFSVTLMSSGGITFTTTCVGHITSQSLRSSAHRTGDVSTTARLDVHSSVCIMPRYMWNLTILEPYSSVSVWGLLDS